MGRLIADSGVKVFQIETTLNTDTFPKQFDFLQKREWEWSARDRAMFIGASKSLERTPRKMARSIFQSLEAPYALTSVQAGEVEAVHKATLEFVHKQQLVSVEGQSDVLLMGLPFLCPYNVNSVMNPILVACLGLGYFFNLYRGKPLVREGGVVIMGHPTRGSSTPCTTRATSTSSSRCSPTRPTWTRSKPSTRRALPRTSGTGTSTARRTPTTACIPSTCGTGARTRCSTWVM